MRMDAYPRENRIVSLRQFQGFSTAEDVGTQGDDKPNPGLFGTLKNRPPVIVELGIFQMTVGIHPADVI
jgi:hypothetical protein